MDSARDSGPPRGGGTWTLELRPRDPILVRDARPFSADPGARAVTLEWPLPATVVGALRTHIGNAVGVDWSADGGRALVREIAVQGPFLLRRGSDGRREVYFPAPRDAVLYRDDENVLRALRLRPIARDVLPASAGSDLWPGLQPVRVTQEVKPTPEAAFWPARDVVAWLADGRSVSPPRHAHGRLPVDVRTHVAIQPDTLTSVAGALFSTEALAFDPRGGAGDDAPNAAMICRAIGAPPSWRPAPAFLRLGGEGRQVALVPTRDDLWPRPDPALVRALTGATRLRLLLATPALFARAWPAPPAAPAPPGWLPEWLDPQTLAGKPPRWPGPAWTLASAVVGRRLALSGWDTRTRTPKRTRYAVPAGSVYFFELPAPLTADQARALWLLPVSDRAYDRRNGFGLVLPGVWEWWEREEAT
jgi:CRISPR-associated protein Cmr3